MRKINLLVSLAVSAALAAPLAAHADAGDTTIGGKVYYDLTSISTKQDTATGSTDKDPNGFGADVKRFYIGVDHSFDDVWSANFTTDFLFPSLSVKGTDSNGDTVTSTGNGAATQVFVKKAYIQGKFDKLATLRLGSADMPWIPFVEGVYGYRFVENTLIDRTHFGNSADWGVHLVGSSDSFSYDVAVVNGGGYKNPSRSKGMDEAGRISFTPVDGLIIAAGLYSGKRGQDTEAKPAVNTVSRQDLLVAWKASGLTAGVEYFSADKWNDVTNTGTTTKSDGYSVFASYDIPNTDFSVFGRYDDVKPTKDTDSSQEDKYYNAGFAWKTGKNLTWALAYKSEKLTDNLKLGNTSDDLKTDEFGLWAQAAF